MEKKEAGTGGALVLAKKLIKSDTFLVIHGDTLIDIKIPDILAFHKDQDVLATIAVTSVLDPSTFGEVILHGARITQFIEKPKKGRQKSQLIRELEYKKYKVLCEAQMPTYNPLKKKSDHFAQV